MHKKWEASTNPLISDFDAGTGVYLVLGTKRRENQSGRRGPKPENNKRYHVDSCTVESSITPTSSMTAVTQTRVHRVSAEWP